MRRWALLGSQLLQERNHRGEKKTPKSPPYLATVVVRKMSASRVILWSGHIVDRIFAPTKGASDHGRARPGVFEVEIHGVVAVGECPPFVNG